MLLTHRILTDILWYPAKLLSITSLLIIKINNNIRTYPMLPDIRYPEIQISVSSPQYTKVNTFNHH